MSIIRNPIRASTRGLLRGPLQGAWGGVINTLALSLNFTTATIGSGTVDANDGNGTSSPTLTYTGDSHKRQYNADGVLEYAPHNLCLQSQDFSNASWPKTGSSVSGNSAIAPDGTLTADTLGDNSGGGSGEVFVSQGFPALPFANTTYKFRVRAKQKQLSWMGLVTAAFTSPADGVSYFDLANGVVGTAASGHTISIEDLSDGWYLCTLEFTVASDVAGSVQIRVCDADGDFNVDKDGTSDIYIWGAEMRIANSPDTYIATTSSAVYAARAGTRNRKPVTNLLTYPEQFNNTDVWTPTASAVSGGQADPFGGSNAFKLNESPADAQHLISQAVATGSKAHTWACYFKAGERSKVLLYLTGPNQGRGFDLATGTSSSVTGINDADRYGIAPVEGYPGWYRCWITEATTASTFARIYILSDFTSTSYDGDDSNSVGLYIASAMLNEGGIEDFVGATNLLTDDKAFGSWSVGGTPGSVTSDSHVAPDGTTTADTLTAGSTNNNLFKVVDLVAGQTYKFSVLLKGGTSSQSAISVLDLSDSSTREGTTIAWSSGVPSGLGFNVTYWGNGYYIYDLTIDNIVTTGSHRIRIYPDNAAGTGTVIAWGAQVTKGSTLYPYVGMSQIGFVKAGYTQEGSATNLVTDSEDFSAGSWTKTQLNATTPVSVNQITAPDGTTTADKIVENTANAQRYINDSFGALSNSTAYVFSVIAKAEERSIIWLSLGGIAFTTANEAYFNLLSGTVGTITGAGTTAGIIPLGNGWYRCWISRVSEGTTSSFAYIGMSEVDGTRSYTGDDSSGLYLWGAQFELGTYPSSYTKTSGGTATRAADFLEDQSVPWLLDDRGTFVIDYHRPAGMANFPQLFDASNSASPTANRVDSYLNSSGVVAGRVSGGGSSSTANTAASVANSQGKVALAYEPDNWNIALNGTASMPDTSQAMPTGLNQLSIGVGDNGTNSPLDGHIKSLQYYAERKSDADLATLSTITDDGTAWRDEVDA
jgi:hypothetical protein